MLLTCLGTAVTMATTARLLPATGARKPSCALCCCLFLSPVLPMASLGKPTVWLG